MKNSKVLKSSLYQLEKYHPLYGDRLASHLPMVLCALSNLGASDNKLELIYQQSITKLNMLDELDDSSLLHDISKDLGNSNKYSHYLQHFQKKIKIFGYEAVLKQTLPVLLPGIAASAFHALIRLAYAIEQNQKEEIAISLAYFCAEFQSFEITSQTSEENLDEILTRLSSITKEFQFSPGIIVDRMTEVSEILRSEQSILQPKIIQFSDIRKLCLKAFAAKDNFTLLHTVTGCHAFRIIEPYIENKELALRELWKAIVVAYLSTRLEYKCGTIELNQVEIDFKKIISHAINSTDNHLIKIIYSCYSEYQQYQDPLYYLVAKRAVGTNLN